MKDRKLFLVCLKLLFVQAGLFLPHDNFRFEVIVYHLNNAVLPRR